MCKPVVAIYQMRLFHYRVSLFERMRELALEHGIDMHVICGQASRNARARNDEGSLPWTDKVKNWYFPVSELKDLCWQPTPSHLKRSDLVILMQENRLLSNYPWLLKRRLGGPKVAYWGHGRDVQADNLNSFQNRFKAALAGFVDWYFAYTDFTRAILLQDGFPEERITVINNAIDTHSLRRDIENAPEDMLTRIRQELDLPKNGLLALYCGSLYPNKMLPLLVEACSLVQAKNPSFRLVIIGDGPSAPQLSQLIAGKAWTRWVGTKRGTEKAAYFRLANMMVNPGGVGLHVLDAFTAGVPLLTTRNARHGPEIAYLKNERNGIITESNPIAFAQAIEKLVMDPKGLAEFVRAAREDSYAYSIEDMVTRFVVGMVQCLRMAKR
jgi:L-malate glycosyltransferase